MNKALYLAILFILPKNGSWDKDFFFGSVKNTNELWDSQTCFCVSLEAGFYHMTPRACSTSMESERFQQLKELTVWFWFSHFQLFSEMSAKPIFAEKEDCKKNWHEIPADFSIKVKVFFDNCRLTNKQTNNVIFP